MDHFKLYLRETDSGRLGRWGRWAYENGLLELTWMGETSYHYVKPGLAMLAELDEERRELRLLVPPRRQGDRVLWLCGVPKCARCRTQEDYAGLVKAFGGPVEETRGQYWKITESRRESGRRYIVAAWAEEEIPWLDHQRLMERFPPEAPRWYIRKVLKRRF